MQKADSSRCFGWQASDLLLEVELEDETRVKCSVSWLAEQAKLIACS